jgi:hypothetical protein
VADPSGEEQAGLVNWSRRIWVNRSHWWMGLG